MERQLDLLVRLIDDLLDVARINRGKLVLRPAATTLQDVLNVAMETSSSWLESGMHPLRVTLPDASLPIQADPHRLSQVFSNLLSNAAKYSDPGTPIEVSAQADDDGVVVEVRDHGIGLTEEQAARIFELFAQIDTSVERSRGGLGIGLTLVRQLVEMHGGTITVDSDWPRPRQQFPRAPAGRRPHRCRARKRAVRPRSGASASERAGAGDVAGWWCSTTTRMPPTRWR